MTANPGLVDTHSHIYLSDFDDDRDEVVQRAQSALVQKILLPNIDRSTVDRLHETEAAYPNICHAMMGLHPCSVGAQFEQELQELLDLFSQRSYIAVGEIGIDLHWDTTYLEQQKKAFLHQVDFAHQNDLPIVIHSRKSIDLIIDLLEKKALPGLRGVFHCFGGDLMQAERIRELGFLMGIGGVATFKNSALPQVLCNVDPKYLILETDAPYLTPHPHRGKRNEPAYVSLVAAKLGEVLALGPDELAAVTSQNAEKLFFS